jgi:hypothetical protein
MGSLALDDFVDSYHLALEEFFRDNPSRQSGSTPTETTRRSETHSDQSRLASSA